MPKIMIDDFQLTIRIYNDVTMSCKFLVSFFCDPFVCQAFGSFKLRDAVPDLADNSWFQAGWGSHGFRVGYCFFFFKIISNNISTSTMGIYKKK